VAEVAVALVLLVGAGLLVRSFDQLQRVPPGFATSDVLTMKFAVTAPKYYRNETAAVQLLQAMEERTARLPGVKAMGLTSVLPLTGQVGWGVVHVEGYNPPPDQELQVDIRNASPDYFRAMDIPLLKGRFFARSDTLEQPFATIIDQKFAQRFWPNESPLGKHLSFDGPGKPFTIVGVVGGVKQYGLDSESKIVMYLSTTQMPNTGTYLVFRTLSDPGSVMPAIRREIHAIEPAGVLYSVRTMNDLLSTSLARPRFSSTMLSAFAVFALLLAAVGVYGVVSFLVSQCTREIGLRMALGARPANILQLVVRQGMELTVLGVAGGLAGAFVLTRLMTSLLFGVKATDAVTFATVVVILCVAALAATVIPAQRAMRVDPIVALRDE
jgi:predicted permease